MTNTHMQDEMTCLLFRLAKDGQKLTDAHIVQWLGQHRTPRPVGQDAKHGQPRTSETPLPASRVVTATTSQHHSSRPHSTE
ncbi:MAG: hypothetical protein CMI16_03150 [Opitutaceae bacterium]|nr:hypothetical protein [Opitutaceae bacterium]